MSATMPAALYRPGTTLLHRLPVGVKLLALVVFSITVLVVHGLLASAGFLAVVLALALLARLPLGLLARATRGILLIAVVVGAFQWWSYGRDKAVESFLDLVTLALAALIVTATTAVNAMLDAITRWLGLFRFLGVSPERVALTIALAIGALPGTFALAVETRDAARARGLRTPRAHLTPFVIRVVARAHETGDALQARGLGDD